ncbi:MAG: hypothetical protein RSF67_04805 [Clostridia bacterium]
MNNEQPFVDFEEELDFILEECKKDGINVSREIIEFILDSDLRFLESKGLATPCPDNN